MKTNYGLLQLLNIVIKGQAHYAHLSQTVTCELPADDLNHEDYLMGFHSGLATRQIYYRIPVQTGMEEFELLLSSYPDARIIRILDHEPILTSNQRSRLRAGVIGLADIAGQQIIRHTDGSAHIDVFGMAVYGQNRLNLSGDLEDQDYRLFLPLSGAEIEHEVLEPILAESFIHA